MNKLKFWKWLLKTSERKFRVAHLDKYKNDVKCSNCNTWFSLSGIDYKHEHLEEPDFGFHIRCGKCGEQTYYNAVIAPVLIRCDKNGVPVE